MERDEIVDETRRVRDEFAKSHDYDGDQPLNFASFYDASDSSWCQPEAGLLYALVA